MTRVLPFPYRSPDHGIWGYKLHGELSSWTIRYAVAHDGTIAGAEIIGPTDEDNPDYVIALGAAVERLGNRIYGHGWADGPQREHGRVYAFPRAAQQSGG